MILNQAQAQAVADAMCAMNNVCIDKMQFRNGSVDIQVSRDEVRVVSYETGASESYADQYGFMTAYNV